VNSLPAGKLSSSPSARCAATCRTVQADGGRLDRLVALIGDSLAIDQREGAQRGHRLVETVARKRGAQRLLEFFPSLREQVQRDRVRRQHGGVDDQRFGGGMKFCSFVDGQREGLRHGQAVRGRRVARVVEKPSWRGFEAPAVCTKREVKPLAIGGSLLVGERQAAERPGQRLGLHALAPAAGTGDQKIGAGILAPDLDLDGRRDAAPGMRIRGDENARRRRAADRA
jgi:hypothetical protein